MGKRQSKVSCKIAPEQGSQHFQTVFRTSEPRDDLPTSDTDGVRQGCILSPALFSLFVNEIAIGMEAVGKHGIQLQPGSVELFLLLFADDLALLSSTAMGLQNQLNHLNSMCKEHSLSSNTEKSKVMVFRKGGFLGKNEK